MKRYAAALLLLLAASCDLPRDANGTLDRVRGGTLRVGLVEHAPWATETEDGPRGVDVRLVEAMAAELDADVEWTWGTLTDLFDAVERRELDLVAGGVPRVWADRAGVGYTRTYYVDSVVVATREGGGKPPLRGTAVAVEPGTAAAAVLRKRGAVPVPREAAALPGGPAAVPAWRAARLGLRPTEHLLLRERRVFAIPAGENGWLVRIERFLEPRRGAGVAALLREEGE
jgi:polar amino acid transport system substrate-binding protein